MKNGNRTTKRARSERVELGQYIVADPAICHGKPTFKGTRIMVWQVLDALARGESTGDIEAAWGGRVSKAAIAETIRLARSAWLDKQGRLSVEAGAGEAETGEDTAVSASCFGTQVMSQLWTAGGPTVIRSAGLAPALDQRKAQSRPQVGAPPAVIGACRANKFRGCLGKLNALDSPR